MSFHLLLPPRLGPKRVARACFCSRPGRDRYLSPGDLISGTVSAWHRLPRSAFARPRRSRADPATRRSPYEKLPLNCCQSYRCTGNLCDRPEYTAPQARRVWTGTHDTELRTGKAEPSMLFSASPRKSLFRRIRSAFSAEFQVRRRSLATRLIGGWKNGCNCFCAARFPGCAADETGTPLRCCLMEQTDCALLASSLRAMLVTL